MDEVYAAATKKAGWGPSKSERESSKKKNMMARKIAPKRSEEEMRHSRLQKIKNVTPAIGNNFNKTK